MFSSITAPTKTPIILLLFNAGPVNITFADKDDRVHAILECFFPAQAAGEAIRHALLYDVQGAVPAGRLPFTWPQFASEVMEKVYLSGGEGVGWVDGRGGGGVVIESDSTIHQ